MTAQPDKIANVCIWVEKADHDLVAAEHSMSIIDQGVTDIICFHCQQCAEKYIKALLVFLSVPFPKTHDLRHLMELVPPEITLGLSKEEVLPLNRYAVEGRYPGDWDRIEAAEAVAAISAARKVRDAVRRCLPTEFMRTDSATRP